MIYGNKGNKIIKARIKDLNVQLNDLVDLYVNANMNNDEYHIIKSAFENISTIILNLKKSLKEDKYRTLVSNNKKYVINFFKKEFNEVIHENYSFYYENNLFFISWGNDNLNHKICISNNILKELVDYINKMNCIK